MKRSPGDKLLTEDDVVATIANPIYAGIGPYPQIIPDDQWVETVAALIEERGAEAVLREFLANLRDAFPLN